MRPPSAGARRLGDLVRLALLAALAAPAGLAGLAGVAVLAAPAVPAAPALPAGVRVSAAAPSGRPGVWFCGDFESGDLRGWAWDLARPESAVVVARPVRRGRYAVRITLAPGDRAASKERAELRIGDKDIERLRGGQSGELWYGWSMLIPADYADPPGDQFQSLAQWHHRPLPQGELPGGKAGPPPLALHLVQVDGRHVLLLVGEASPAAPPRILGGHRIRYGAWTDLVFHIRCSTRRDGYVEAWADGQPFTKGRIHGPTLYTPVSNYLRLGLYRGKGIPTTNVVYYDEVRLGGSYRAVAP